jgi:hypothetical protein
MRLANGMDEKESSSELGKVAEAPLVHTTQSLMPLPDIVAEAVWIAEDPTCCEIDLKIRTVSPTLSVHGALSTIAEIEEHTTATTNDSQPSSSGQCNEGDDIPASDSVHELRADTPEASAITDAPPDVVNHDDAIANVSCAMDTFLQGRGIYTVPIDEQSTDDPKGQDIRALSTSSQSDDDIIASAAAEVIIGALSSDELSLGELQSAKTLPLIPTSNPADFSDTTALVTTQENIEGVLNVGTDILHCILIAVMLENNSLNLFIYSHSQLVSSHLLSPSLQKILVSCMFLAMIFSLMFLSWTEIGGKAPRRRGK